MADALNVLEKNLRVSLELANPGEDISARLDFLRRKFKGLLADNEKLKKAYGSVNDGIGALTNSLDGFANSAEAIAEKASTGFGKIKGAIGGATRGVVRSAKMFDLVSTAIIGAVTAAVSLAKVASNLDQGLIKAAASASRLGIGIGELEEKFKSVARQTSLTRQAVTGLFDAYQMDMRFASLEGFENMMKRIQEVVGPNEQAMGQMAGVITSLSGKFPELARQLQNVNDSNRDALEATVIRLRMQGDLTDAEDRTARAYISGLSRMGAEDRKIYEEKMKQQEAMGKIKRAFEALAVEAGRVVLPIIQSITEWVEKLADKTEGWENWIGKAVVAAVLLKGALMAINMVAAAQSVLGFGVAAAGTRGLVAAGGAKIGVGLAKAGGAVKGAAAGLGSLVGGGAIVGGSLAALIVGAIYSGGTMLIPGFAEAQANQPWIRTIIDKIPDKLMTTKGRIGGVQDTSINDAQMKKLQMEGEVFKPTKKYDKSFEGRAEKARDEKAFFEERAKMRSQESYKSGADKRKELKEAKRLKAEEEGIIQANNVRIQKAVLLASLYKTQSSHLSTMIENMAASGDIDLETAFSQAAAGIATLKAEQEELLKIQQIMVNPDLKGKDMSKIDLSAQAELVKSNKQISQETKDKIQAQQDAGTLTLTELSNMIKLEGIGEKLQASKLKEKQNYIGMIKLHDVRIKSFELEANRANKLVQIADNYAIGVGASAKMRMDVYAAEGKKIDELERQLNTNAMAQSEAGNSAERNLLLANQRVEIENKILDATLAQNQAVKAMRDGWVSAISAMNTGAGGFSEIIMNAEQNTAQIQRLEGSIRTSFGGAFGRGKEVVGYDVSTKFGIGGLGQLQGPAGGVPSGQAVTAYDTDADKMLKRRGIDPIASLVQTHGRGSATERFNLITGSMRGQGEETVSGGLQTLGAAANKNILGSMTISLDPRNVERHGGPPPGPPPSPPPRRMLGGPVSTNTGSKTGPAIPHAAAATNIASTGAGADSVRTAVFPNANISFQVLNTEGILKDGKRLLTQGVTELVIDMVNAGVSS